MKFGAEFEYLCQECYDEHMKHRHNNWHDWSCEKCGTQDVRPVRDPDEGTSGPVYYLCKTCIGKLNDYHAHQEAA